MLIHRPGQQGVFRFSLDLRMYVGRLKHTSTEYVCLEAGKCYIDGTFHHFYGVTVIDANIFYVYVFERYSLLTAMLHELYLLVFEFKTYSYVIIFV